MSKSKAALDPANAGEGMIFQVSAKGGKIGVVPMDKAVDDVLAEEIFTRDQTEKAIANGEAVFSENFYYANHAWALEKLPNMPKPVAKYGDVSEPEADAAPAEEVPAEAAPEATEAAPEPSAEKPEPKATAVKSLAEVTVDAEKLNGELIVHIKKGTFGQFVLEDGKEYVEVAKGSTEADGKERKPLKRKDWRIANQQEFWDNVANVDQTIQPAATEAETEETALAKTEPAIEGEVIHGKPLSKKESKRLGELEAKYEEADAIERNVPFVKARILAEIRDSQLFRETHNTMAEYAFARFGITREYAQNLMQIAGIPDLLAGAVEGGEQVALSVNTANAIIRDQNKLSKALGLGKSELETVAPILRNALALAVDIAPKDSEGKPELTPRFIHSFNEVLTTHLTDGVVTVDGEQMTIKAAQEKGLLNASLRNEVIQGAAESIRTQGELIRDHYQKSFGEGNESAKPAKPALPDNTQYYKGALPTLTISCSLHEDTEITSIGTGKIQTRCGCRFLIDNESSELTAFEVNELPVKRG